MNVLIIDSNFNKANWLIDTLNSFDFVQSIHFYSYGLEAVCDIFNENNMFDFIIIDSNLKWNKENNLRKDGYVHLLNLLKSKNIHIPVIMNSFDKMPKDLYSFEDIVSFIALHKDNENKHCFSLKNENTTKDILYQVLYRNSKDFLLNEKVV